MQPIAKNTLTTKFLRKSKQRFLFVGRNSSLHGLNRLFNPNTNKLTRFFWLLAILASIGGVYLMMEPVLDLGVEINYTPDTVYLDWNTVFPGVTVCEELNIKLSVRKFLGLYPELLEPLSVDYRRYLTNILYASGQCGSDQCEPCGISIPCNLPWRDMIEKVHKSCEDMLSECSYNGATFPCCKYFRVVDSEYGSCYSFNTLQHKEPVTLFSVNRSTGPGVLSVRLQYDAAVSIHSSEELSTNNLDKNMKQVFHKNHENEVDWLFSVVEIENDPMMQTHHIDERQCRFLDEVPDGRLHTYPVYSYGACQLAHSTEELFQHCGCIHPARDLSYKKYYCNYTGMNCWNNFEEDNLPKTKSVSETTKEDECVPSCVESELTTVHFVKRWVSEGSDKPGILVNMKMVSLPTLRYQRNFRRTHLDVVVSVGGIAGLFFSASILSFLEVFYLILRP